MFFEKLGYLFLMICTSISIDMPSAQLDFIRTAPAGDPHFYDEQGRVRIFHGSNRVWKGPPWYFQDMVDNDSEFELMKAMGFNVMRLGYMWSGYNPVEGFFNQTYVDIIKTIVQKMANHGVYTMFDMHEDVLSSKFCLYDGAPLWVINKSISKHPFPWPLKGNCSSRGWMSNTLTEAATTAYQDIYDNNHGMLDDLCSFWEHSAEQFADVSNVIGYEIMNEPFAGNVYADPTLLLPGVAGKKNLQRMNDAVASAIRKHDERHIIFYEPVTWGMLFEGKIVGSGFDHVPGGDLYQNRSAFSYHYYCGSFVPDYQDDPIMRKIVCDEGIGPLVFEAVKKDLLKLGGAAIMTEGMACGKNLTDPDNECAVVMKYLDQHLFSWTDYGVSQGAVWKPNIDQQRAWARTYAQAIAGTPKNMTFNPATKDFEFCFILDLTINAATEIFASNTYSYPSGRSITTTENLKVSEMNDKIFVTPTISAKKNSVGCVWIKKKIIM